MKHERVCSVCGKHYEYCPNCSRYMNLPRWMFMFHDENCKKIYDVINAYKTGEISADSARARLIKLDPQRRIVTDAGFKKAIDEIYKKATPAPQQKNNSENKFNK